MNLSIKTPAFVAYNALIDPARRPHLNLQHYKEELKAGLFEKKKAKAPKPPSGIHPPQSEIF